MSKIFNQIWKSKSLRNKILFTLFIVVIVRLISQITIPGANLSAIQAIFQQNQLLGTLSLLTGGSAENFSILLMGLGPYINASIIIQLLAVIIPKWESLNKEGDQGRRKLNQYTRLLTIPLALIQSYGMILILNSQAQTQIIENINSWQVIVPIMLTVTAGSILLMWLGELISEKGIGNGSSIIIFAGIAAGFPQVIGQNILLAQTSSQQLIPFVIMILVTLISMVAVVLFTEAERKIPILYASRGVKSGSDKSFLPLKINQAGMIPIIFGLSVVSFPGIIAQFMTNSQNQTLRDIASFINTYLNQNTIYYSLFFFILIVAFTFFYVSITFNPEEVADNLQKRGSYVPGLRPGKQTADYLAKVSNHLNLFGGVFIAVIAIIPNILQLFSTSLSIGAIPTLITGSGLIIIVSVILDIVRQVNAQVVMHDYNKLY